MLGAARIWFALSRDGLLPGWFAKVHPRYGTPHRPTIALGIFTALVAGLFPLGDVAKLVNIGVLSAFIVICASVLLLRVRKPEFALITWMVFLGWVALGVLIYFSYGIRHSKLALEANRQA